MHCERDEAREALEVKAGVSRFPSSCVLQTHLPRDNKATSSSLLAAQMQKKCKEEVQRGADDDERLAQNQFEKGMGEVLDEQGRLNFEEGKK